MAPSDKLQAKDMSSFAMRCAEPARSELLITIAGREWLVAIAPIENGLLVETLRYAEELRTPKDFFDEVPTIKPDKEMVDLAVDSSTEVQARFILSSSKIIISRIEEARAGQVEGPQDHCRAGRASSKRRECGRFDGCAEEERQCLQVEK